MFIPVQHAHLRGGLSSFAQRFAATKDMSDEQLRLEPKRPPRPPKARPRSSRLPPRSSRQYAGAMATTVMRDQRITPGAAKLAHLLVALAGRGDVIETERWRLARSLGVSVRTLARYLADLRGGEEHASYIATEHLVNARGMVVGIRIIILEPLRPYWRQSQPIPAVTKLSGKECLLTIGESASRIYTPQGDSKDILPQARAPDDRCQSHNNISLCRRCPD